MILRLQVVVEVKDDGLSRDAGVDVLMSILAAQLAQGLELPWVLDFEVGDGGTMRP